MPSVGYFLSSEEHGPKELVDYARMGEDAGFTDVFVSDHFHPWTDTQGQSPFVWSVIGGIASATNLRVTTGVTCPTTRIHPAILAQATATCSLMLDGRFRFGVGTGEALNEHILGDRWPPAPLRLEMLAEALDVIRQLWAGGFVTHYGRFYTVEAARIYSRPEQPPPILMSGFGPRSIECAAEIADGYIITGPDADATARYRSFGGRGATLGAMKVCWDHEEAAARKLAHEQWRTTAVPGELNQDLPSPRHFEQAAESVTEDMVADAIPCGPDPERHAKAIAAYFDAGFDEVHVSQIGDDQEGFLRFFFKEVKPRLKL